MDLIEMIVSEAQEDMDDSGRQSRLISELFENASPEERKAMNELLVCICGWQFESLQNMLDE